MSSSSSNRFICKLMVDCERWSSWLARVNPPVLAASRNTLSCCRSIEKTDYMDPIYELSNEVR